MKTHSLRVGHLVVGGSLLLALGLVGCNSDKGSGASGGPSASGAAATKGAGSSLAKEALEARLKKAGWTVEDPQDMDVEYKRLSLGVSKKEGEAEVTADVNVLYLTEPYDTKRPKAVVHASKTAALRIAWVPSEDGKKGPDLETIKKDILAKAQPEKVMDDVFFKDFDKLAESWKLANDSSRGGGSSWGAVFQNYRFLSGDGGTVSIHVVALGEGVSQIVGTNVVWVEAEDAAVAKKVLAIVAGG